MVGASRLLLVEDHPDVREALSEFLSSEGFEVTGRESAEAGLAALREGGYSVLVTDYALPGKDGAWLVEAAREQGWLPPRAVMVTAVPQDVQVDGVRVLRKPLDLGELLSEIRRDGGVAASGSYRIEFVLYTSAPSDASRRARHNLERVLAGYADEDVQLTICDLSAGITAGAVADKIGRTPTLVKRWPSPPAWIAGDLAQPEPLHDLLQAAGARRRS